MKNQYEFSIILKPLKKINYSKFVDSFYERCDDALISFQGTICTLDFIRYANSSKEAIDSAKEDIKKSNPNVEIQTIKVGD